MSEEEKIRRAKEIAERRGSRIPANSINRREKNSISFLNKTLIQIIVSICLFGVIYYLSQNHSYAMELIKPVISRDTDFQKIYFDINEIVKGFMEENQKNNEEFGEKEQKNSEETNNKDEQDGMGGVEETQTSENESDSDYIKNNASFIKPVEGIITSKYGEREGNEIISSNHGGIDIGASTGTNIVASMEGTVNLVSTEGDYGQHIVITNGEISTVYAHCSELLVNQGDYVEQGKLIAKVGSTGKATGPHLHFEIRRNNVTVNPEQILNLE